MIGVAYSTRNRREIAEKNINQCRRFLPDNSRFVIVDDASYISYPGADFRFNENAGVARVKNKCLELLDTCPVHVYVRRPIERDHSFYSYIFTDRKFIYKP